MHPPTFHPTADVFYNANKNFAVHAWQHAYMFDYWAVPVVHLLLLKSSMAKVQVTSSNPDDSDFWQRSISFIPISL